MKKKTILSICTIGLVSILLTGCCLTHDWQEATCTTPETCSKCGKTEGEAPGHTWQEATCTAPKTCSVCGATEGQASAHTWKPATCMEPETCSVCGITEGGLADHTLDSSGRCENCGAQVGYALTLQNYNDYFEIENVLKKWKGYTSGVTINVKPKKDATYSNVVVYITYIDSLIQGSIFNNHTYNTQMSIDSLGYGSLDIDCIYADEYNQVYGYDSYEITNITGYFIR